MEYLLGMVIVAYLAYKSGYKKGIDDEKYRYKRMMIKKRWE